jgi:iron complex outermembrane recepter protein
MIIRTAYKDGLTTEITGWLWRRLSAAAGFSAMTIGLAVAALWLAVAATGAAADEGVPSSSLNDWQNLTLEQLVNVQVTSVSKKQTDLFTSPAAIYVITQEDIRRSGLTSIPELLRMVPGLDVARIDANHWAISARGFNDQYADKLLVLIDGRTVYEPQFAGVYWNVEDLPLEDIDRIEVIRGPGATLWGANAVNGVINVITKNAKDTQGGLVSVTYGTEDQPSTTVRYGGALGTNLFYRAYVKYFDREGFLDAPGRDGADAWDMLRGGFRLDWEGSDINRLTLQGDYYYSNAGQPFDDTSLTPPFSRPLDIVNHDQGGNVLGRWTHTFSETSQLTLQLYYDHVREGAFLITGTTDTYDFDLQHRFAWGERQDIVWGVGYRYQNSNTATNFILQFIPSSDHDQLFSAFVQDEVTVVQNRLHLTIGSKFEHNDFTGFEVQPSGRLAWTPTERQTVWAAVSRAVRTPSLFDLGMRSNLSAFQPPSGPPILIAAFGSPNFKSEELLAYELGYRVEPVKQLSFDVAAFYNVYDRLRNYVQGVSQLEIDPAPPHLLIPLMIENSQRGETYGAELLAEWRVTDDWKLIASYTWLQMHVGPDVLGQSNNNDSPQNEFQLRSSLSLPHNVELDGAVYYVDQVAPILGLSEKQVPAYVRLDLGVTWRPIRSLEIGIWGQNLADNRHAEFTNYKTSLISEVPRSVLGRVTWRF